MDESIDERYRRNSEHPDTFSPYGPCEWRMEDGRVNNEDESSGLSPRNTAPIKPPTENSTSATVRPLTLSELIRREWRFLGLLLWTYPFKRETDRYVKSNSSFIAHAIVIPMVVGSFLGLPPISASNYPALSAATLVEGNVVRDPKLLGGGKYTSEPFGVQTATGVVFKQCTRMSAACLPKVIWREAEGKPARMWYVGDWVVQVEIDGVIPPSRSYEEQKKRLTENFFLNFFLPIGMALVAYGLLRLVRRYGRQARTEVSKRCDETNNIARSN